MKTIIFQPAHCSAITVPPAAASRSIRGTTRSLSVLLARARWRPSFAPAARLRCSFFQFFDVVNKIDYPRWNDVIFRSGTRASFWFLLELAY